MYNWLSVRIKGRLDQLMHNGRLKNPLDFWAKEIRKYSGKRKKTDEDHVAMMEAEFKGSLYLYDDDNGSHPYNGQHPYWPHDNLHACIKTAAKDKKLGKVVDSAVVISPPGGRLIFDGPKTRNSLWEDDKRRLVKPTRRGIMCCRPMFSAGWEVEFSLRYLEEKLNLDELKGLIVDAGKYVGLSDWPRRYGLFDVVGFTEKEVTIDVTKK